LASGKPVNPVDERIDATACAWLLPITNKSSGRKK
jgi:hypothetical protein